MLRLRVKEVAQQKNMSMHRLSLKSEVSYHVIREIFINPYKPVSTYTLDRIAEALDVPITALIEDVPKWQAEEERKRLKGRLGGS
ncbi:MAG: helix-turn-helix transcriptional regulator [Thermogemmatispora sp.]|uniref:helix-turn-helix domain-containing protein n=1 Tax=Thermogemmatispora sp. TaxID=1968838 RepID=UPI00261BB74C|nr:helix-turn-helix transcriptional regulator [Thermogemmatispora sp.]MBX5459366.1 helix-turn-helix transcriptional regulator [Thermogemmatispora sp.]